MLVRVLHQHDRGVDHGADRDGDPSEAHDVGVDAEEAHGNERQRHRHRERQHGHQRAAQVEQEDEDHEAHDDGLLHQRVPQRLDRAGDERRSVVHGAHLDAGRERGLELVELLLHARDHLLRVLAVAHDDGAAHGLALAVQLGDAAADVGPERHPAQVGDADRGSGAAVDAHGHLAQVVERVHVAAATHEVFAARHLDHPSTHLSIAAPERSRYVGQREAVRVQPRGIHLDLVLALVATHGGHLGHAGHARERVAQVEVLERAQLGQVVSPALVDQRVLEDPAHGGRVGPERGAHTLGQPAAQRAQVFEHAAPRPVEVGALLEDDVDEAHAEHALAAHRGDLRRGEQARHDRVRHLVLDQVRAAAHPLREHDDLRVGQVRDRVHRDAAHGEHGRDERDRRQHDHEPAAPRAPLDEPGDHGGLSARARTARASRRRARSRRRGPRWRPSGGSRSRSGTRRSPPRCRPRRAPASR